jgi:protein-disulfide isomerase
MVFMMMKRILIAFLAFVLLSAFADSHIERHQSSEDLLSLRTDDIYLGSVDAPIIMIEYDSLSCIHCAHFNSDILPYIKENYIDKGYVLFVMRDFPMDSAACHASMLAHCYAKGDASKFEHLRDSLFRHQRNWLKNDYKSALRNIAKLAGMSEEEIDFCINNLELKTKVAKSRLDAITSLDVDSTPMFFINGIRSPGLNSVEYFDSMISEILQEKSHFAKE